eukprot:scaffold15780_cov68-Phaeocystis_antarctica.AAC.17
MLVPIAVPKLAHDDAAEHLTRGDRSHPAQSVTVHSATPAAFPSNAAKRAAPPPELPPNKQPCLASSARPLQAVRHESSLCNPSLESTSAILGVRDPRGIQPAARRMAAPTPSGSTAARSTPIGCVASPTSGPLPTAAGRRRPELFPCFGARRRLRPHAPTATPATAVPGGFRTSKAAKSEAWCNTGVNKLDRELNQV